jgi:hypothetical protein
MLPFEVDSAYLVMQPTFGMFLLWFGSLADPAAHQGLSLNIIHPSVMNQLTHSLTAIHAMIEELDFQSRPVHQGLLTPYPRDLAEQVLQAARNDQSTG